MLGNQKIKIIFCGYDFKALDNALQQTVSTVRRTGGRVVGPIPLPTKIQRFTVNRSTFIDKKSREQFEIRTHKRLLFIEDPTQQTIDELGKTEIASGIHVELRLQ